ncbi:hypothetical protein [Chengkuizengella axinellae]|uniref:RecT family protein n=1 Tax=Chengkuizengella axinellae TaxID=3064388 RepID=A0ABT9J6I4_9BACL|nr:hypothetical protein [Chengkuizengella sp. 2205SS18-9]MDP5277227.1 hypothetical protein [Chengkuizengella sp. 2205SS18-9]
MSEFSTALAKVTDTYAPMIERQLVGNGVQMDEYSKQCVVSAISSINSVLDVKNLAWNDEQLDQSNVTQILLNVASLKLNAAASPKEVFFSIRKVKLGDKWKKQIEMGIEGDGNDAILARFGRDVKKVGQFWLVREDDDFEYPKYNGFETTPPQWTPKGTGDVVRIVYPILKKDDTHEYYIAERADVARNLVAHINNNLMNETFGICKNRYEAKPQEKQQINEKKVEVLKKAKELGLDALDDAEMQKYISPAWTEYQSREQMLIRKMRNNIVKKIPKNFGSAFIEMVHSEVTDDTTTIVRKEISENANREVIDVEIVEPENLKETKDEPQPEEIPTEKAEEGPGF